MTRYPQQRDTIHGECDKQNTLLCNVDEWESLLLSVQNKSFATQLEAINDFANAHPYIIDRINWGIEDYWETPYEFLDVSGDCEDYAIIKYYSLRALGIASERLHIIIVQDMNLGGIVHAILGASDGDKLYILDNQIKRVVSADSIYHYKPIYSINETAWWLYSQPQ